MEYTITQTEYDKIEHLAHCAVSCTSKKDAKYYIDRLEFIARAGGYAGSVKNIIGELCSSVSNAAGSVADKSRRVYFADISDLTRNPQLLHAVGDFSCSDSILKLLF